MVKFVFLDLSLSMMLLQVGKITLFPRTASRENRTCANQKKDLPDGKVLLIIKGMRFILYYCILLNRILKSLQK